MLAAFGRDLTFALRDLRRAPGLTIAVVLTLGVALAADTAMFSLIHSTLLRPLPYRDAERLVRLWESNPEKGWVHQSAAPANFLDWRDQARSFEDIAAYSYFDGAAVTFTGDGEATRLGMANATGNLFEVMGTEPLLGRFFEWEETFESDADLVVLSHRAWQERFGGDPAIVGRALTLNDRPFTVIGVTRPGFRLPDADPELWLLMAWQPELRAEVWFRRAHFVLPIGRLAPGVSAEAAAAELREVATRLEREYPQTNTQMGAGLTPLHAWVVDDARLLLWTLLAGVSVVMLIACANAAHLLLARAVSRANDLRVRQALGASRAAVVRHALSESLVLAVASGALGLVLAVFGLRLLRTHGPDDLPRLWELELRPAAVLFAFALVVVAMVLSGLLPALHAASRSRMVGGDGHRTGSTRGQQRLRRGLVAAEVALAVLLVAGGGLFLRSLGALVRVETGFDAASVVTAHVSLPGRRFEPPARLSFFDSLTERLAGLPDVEAVGLVSSLPLGSTTWTTTLTVEGLGEESFIPEIQHRTIDPGYLGAMRVALVAGRGFERDEPAPAAILNRTAVDRHFGGADPIGRRVSTSGRDEEPEWLVVVGVVEDEVQNDLRSPVMPQLYEPLVQDPRSSMTVVLRGGGGPDVLGAAVRSAVAEIDPTVPVERVVEMREVLRESLQLERFLLLATGGFSAFALLLAVLGVYGVLSYWVSSRARELGLLQALGASTGDLRRLVLRQGMTAAGVGVGCGLVAAIVAGRVLEGLLFRVSGRDPLTLASVVALVLLSALLACALPALRASRVQPATAMREA